MPSCGMASRLSICMTPMYCSLVKPDIVIGTRSPLFAPQLLVGCATLKGSPSRVVLSLKV